MSFTEKFNKWTDSTLKVFLIILIAFAIAWGTLSLIGDFTEASTEPPNDAAYQFTIRNTGEILYTANYDHPSDNVYILHGYWELVKNKYRYRDIDLTLDKTIFGPIKVEGVMR